MKKAFLINLLFASIAFSQVSNPSTADTFGSSAFAGTIESNSFTPTANVLLVAVFLNNGSVNRDHDSVADDNDDIGSWNLIATTSSSNARVSAWWAIVGSSPNAGVVTMTASGSMERRASGMFEFTGYNVSSPIAESGTGSGTGTTLTITLSDIAANAAAIGMINSVGATGITAGSGETEQAEWSSGGGTPAVGQFEYGTTVGVDWSTLATSANAAVAFEISPAAGAVVRRKVIF